MWLHVGNIPRLANEEALAKWFEHAGVAVKTVELEHENDDCRNALVETQNDGFPFKALRHLKSVAFWGRFLVIQKEYAGRALVPAANRTAESVLTRQDSPMVPGADVGPWI